MVEMAVSRAKSASDKSLERRESALAIVMAVNAVEVFLNLYFRVLVEEEDFKKHKNYLLKNFKERKGLDFKVKNWPKVILKKPIDLSQGIGKDFQKVKSLRNNIVHFTSTHETIELSNSSIFMNGLANTTEYNALDKHKAQHALDTARIFVSSIVSIRGVKEPHLSNVMHGWCGLPINKSNHSDSENCAGV